MILKKWPLILAMIKEFDLEVQQIPIQLMGKKGMVLNLSELKINSLRDYFQRSVLDSAKKRLAVGIKKAGRGELVKEEEEKLSRFKTHVEKLESFSDEVLKSQVHLGLSIGLIREQKDLISKLKEKLSKEDVAGSVLLLEMVAEVERECDVVLNYLENNDQIMSQLK